MCSRPWGHSGPSRFGPDHPRSATHRLRPFAARHGIPHGCDRSRCPEQSGPAPRSLPSPEREFCDERHSRRDCQAFHRSSRRCCRGCHEGRRPASRGHASGTPPATRSRTGPQPAAARAPLGQALAGHLPARRVHSDDRPQAARMGGFFRGSMADAVAIRVWRAVDRRIYFVLSRVFCHIRGLPQLSLGPNLA